MGTKYKNLKDQICSWDNLLLAYRKTSKGKRNTRSYLQFREYDILNLEKIQNDLISESYKMDEFHTFDIYVPKHRKIQALSFRDRIVQHAICNVIEPIFDKTFLSNSYACRKNKGTHAGVKYVQSILRKYPEKNYVLKTDFSKYFPSIQYDLLFELIKKKISCRFTLSMLRVFLPSGGCGLPVGWLISQLMANVFGSAVDHYLQHELKLKHWARYMDDIVIIHEDLALLKNVKIQLEAFSLERLKMRLSKWSIQSISRGINFLGYRIWRTHKLIRKDSARRVKQKCYKYTHYSDLEKFVCSWNGHIKWANCNNLKRWLQNYVYNHQYSTRPRYS